MINLLPTADQSGVFYEKTNQVNIIRPDPVASPVYG
jgi:hypothetical protein